MKDYFIGVDVGSGSARVGIFDAKGIKISEAKRDTLMFKPRTDFVEQSSDNIWQCVCESVKDAMFQAQLSPIQIKGIGFDATCSLVVLDSQGHPLTVSPTGHNEQNIIMWMDHRAIEEAKFINDTKHEVLTYVGNRISPEMETPKLLWLKTNMPETWSNAHYFFDLPDFLTWKATADNSRSLCSTVCKWTYLGHENRWSDDYFKQIGLDDLLDNDARKIGSSVQPLGETLGTGLVQQAANDLGLIAGIPVGTSIVDAHAGGIGVLGSVNVPGEKIDFNKRIALIGGTSSCHMAVAPEARFIDGVWGAYYGAMIPEFWLNEGGQSATGALIDYVITSHAYYSELKADAINHNSTVYQLLNDKLLALAGSSEDIAFLTKNVHILPYFHGNRSPRANPSLTGMMTGLKMSHGLDDLALKYLATIQAIALGTRHIIEVMNNTGYEIDTIIACGGGTKNSLFVQEHANATACAMLLPTENEAVLLGSAMLGAVASGRYKNIPEAMAKMSSIGTMVTPQTARIKQFYDAKYQVFHQMYEDDMKYNALMAEF